MRYLVNFSNQVAAGPRMIARNFILESLKSDGSYIFIIPNIEFYDDLPLSEHVQYIRVASYAGSWKSLVLVFYVNLFLIRKLCQKSDVTGLLSFGNFSFGCENIPSVALLHHPYLVDDELYSNLPLLSKFVEFLKRRIFIKTVKSCKKIIVQTENMQSLYLKKYGQLNSNVVVIPNPVAGQFEGSNNPNRNFDKNDITLFYPSRFYPHKNHQQALDLALRAKERKLPLKVFVTINPCIPGASSLLNKAKKISNFVNLGELSQEALLPLYNQATYMFFPSLSETYGNPLAEAMIVDLPVIAPDMGYSHSVVKNAGWYFNAKDKRLDVSNAILDYIFSSSNDDYNKLLAETIFSKDSLFFPIEWHSKILKLYDNI